MLKPGAEEMWQVFLSPKWQANWVSRSSDLMPLASKALLRGVALSISPRERIRDLNFSLEYHVEDWHTSSAFTELQNLRIFILHMVKHLSI
jgi:hypothetical protein